jgi:hypothetical protein
MACKKRCRTVDQYADQYDNIDLLFDDETNKIFDDVFLNIFDYVKPVITDISFKCKKCIDDILITEYTNEYGCLDCDEINILSQLKKCTRCRKIMPPDFKFKKCGECLRKQRLQRYRKHPEKQCDECNGPVKSNSNNTKCEKCIIDKKLTRCTKCHIILQDGYRFKICIPCRENKKQLENKLRENKRCVSCKIKLPDIYKFKNCSECLKKKNKSRQFYVINKKCIKCICDLPESYPHTMCSICSYNKRNKYSQKK